MTIILTPETETLLRARAKLEGAEMNALADSLLAATLQDEEQMATIESLRRGLEDSDAGRVRPFAEYTAEMRSRYDLPVHLSDEELHTAP